MKKLILFIKSQMILATILFAPLGFAKGWANEGDLQSILDSSVQQKEGVIEYLALTYFDSLLKAVHETGDVEGEEKWGTLFQKLFGLSQKEITERRTRLSDEIKLPPEVEIRIETLAKIAIFSETGQDSDFQQILSAYKKKNEDQGDGEFVRTLETIWKAGQFFKRVKEDLHTLKITSIKQTPLKTFFANRQALSRESRVFLMTIFSNEFFYKGYRGGEPRTRLDLSEQDELKNIFVRGEYTARDFEDFFSIYFSHQERLESVYSDWNSSRRATSGFAFGMTLRLPHQREPDPWRIFLGAEPRGIFFSSTTIRAMDLAKNITPIAATASAAAIGITVGSVAAAPYVASILTGGVHWLMGLLPSSVQTAVAGSIFLIAVEDTQDLVNEIEERPTSLRENHLIRFGKYVAILCVVGKVLGLMPGRIAQGISYASRAGFAISEFKDGNVITGAGYALMPRLGPVEPGAPRSGQFRVLPRARGVRIIRVSPGNASRARYRYPTDGTSALQPELVFLPQTAPFRPSALLVGSPQGFLLPVPFEEFINPQKIIENESEEKSKRTHRIVIYHPNSNPGESAYETVHELTDEEWANYVRTGTLPHRIARTSLDQVIQGGGAAAPQDSLVLGFQNSSQEQTTQLREVFFSPIISDPDEITKWAPLKPGKKIGRYTVTGQFIGGGMSNIYQATNQEGEKVLIKISDANPFALACLWREYEVLVYLNRLWGDAQSRPFPRVFEAGAVDDGPHYFVMEKIEGQPFNEVVFGNEKLVISAYARAARSMQAIHNLGITHGDMKPANLILKKNGDVVVIDFGLALYVADPPCAGDSIFGTPIYMSPEVILGKHIGPKADSWSLAICLINSESGGWPYHPFLRPDATVKQIISHIAYLDSPPPLPSVISIRLADILRRALAIDPEDRLTCLEFAKSLEQLIELSGEKKK